MPKDGTSNTFQMSRAMHASHYEAGFQIVKEVFVNGCSTLA
jgi:hypothetical protein